MFLASEMDYAIRVTDLVNENMGTIRKRLVEEYLDSNYEQFQILRELC